MCPTITCKIDHIALLYIWFRSMKQIERYNNIYPKKIHRVLIYLIAFLKIINIQNTLKPQTYDLACLVGPHLVKVAQPQLNLGIIHGRLNGTLLGAIRQDMFQFRTFLSQELHCVSPPHGGRARKWKAPFFAPAIDLSASIQKYVELFHATLGCCSVKSVIAYSIVAQSIPLLGVVQLCEKPRQHIATFAVDSPLDQGSQL